MLSNNGLNKSNDVLIPARKELRQYPRTKLKNLQWQKLDPKLTENTIWKLGKIDDSASMEDKLIENKVFDKIDSLFPAKENLFLEKRQKKMEVQNQASVTRFLNKDKNKNISKYFISG